MTKKLSNNQVLLKEIVEAEFRESTCFSTVNEYFEFFSAKQILKDYEFSDEEIENGIIGGGNDGGCDSMYVLLNGEIITPDQVENLSCSKGAIIELIIIQSKFVTGFGEDAIMKWKTASKNLLDMAGDLSVFQDRYNEKTIETFSLFQSVIKKLIRNQVKISIKYVYATYATELHPHVIAQSEELKGTIRSIFPSASVSTEFVNANNLLDLYNSEPNFSVCVNLADQAITLGRSDEYITLINLVDYYNFITDTSGKIRKGIFEANVRDYQGGNSVNSCIAKTLEESKEEDFWWLNNGVTVLADKISLETSKILSVVNPQIVNGLQTSTEIFNYFSAHQDKKECEKRNILVRFVVPSTEAVRDDIIFATNNQTNIPKSSLRVTDPIHLQIDIYCKARGLFYDRRKNYYRNQKKKSSEIISVSFLAQCLISVLLKQPDIARARPSTLLTEDETYNKLYSQSADLALYYKIGKIGKSVQLNLKKSSEMSTSERSDIMFYLLYGVFAKYFNKAKVSSTDIIQLDENDINDELIDSVKALIYNKYKELGGNGRVAKSSDFVSHIDKLLGIK